MLLTFLPAADYPLLNFFMATAGAPPLTLSDKGVQPYVDALHNNTKTAAANDSGPCASFSPEGLATCFKPLRCTVCMLPDAEMCRLFAVLGNACELLHVRRPMPCIRKPLTRARCVCPRPRAVYVFVSYRLFQLTGTLKNAVVPAKAGRELARNCTLIAVVGGGLWLASLLLIRLGGGHSAGSAFLDPAAVTKAGDYVEVIPQG